LGCSFVFGLCTLKPKNLQKLFKKTKKTCFPKILALSTPGIGQAQPIVGLLYQVLVMLCA